MVLRYGSIPENDVENSENHSTINKVTIIFTKHKNKIFGVLLSMFSGTLFTANNFLINQFQVIVSDAVLVRCFIQTIIFAFIIFWKGDKFFPESLSKKLLAVSQGLSGAISFITCLASVSFMPVPDALCIIFTCPVVTMVLSAIILGDKLNSLKCFSGFLLLIGVVLVTQPPFLFSGVPSTLLSSFLLTPSHDELYYVGVALAVSGCVMGGLMRVLIAKCEGVSISVLLSWAANWGLVLSVGYCLLQPGSRILSDSISSISWRDWVLLLGLAFSGLLAFTTMTLALKLISPNLVSAFRALELVLAFFVQAILTEEAPDTWSCMGGLLILFGVLILTFQENISDMFTSLHRSHNGDLYEAARTHSVYTSLEEASQMSGHVRQR